MRIRIAVGVVAIALLAGCGAPTPVPTGTASPSSSAPVPEVVEAPELRLPLTCDQIVAPATVATFADGEVPVYSDTDAVPTSWIDVMKRQVGEVSCTWAATGMYETLVISVVPGAASDFQAFRDSIYATYYERFDAVGDESVHSCAYGQCSFNVLVDDFWISGSATRPDLMDELDLEPVFLPVLRELVGSIEAAIPGERAAWSAPSGVLRGWGPWCTAESAAVIADALGRPALVVDGGGTDGAGIASAVFREGKPSWCSLYDESSQTYADAVLIEGGGWVGDLWATSPPLPNHGPAYEAMVVEGVGPVYVVRDGTGYHGAMFVLDGSLVSLGYYAAGLEEFLTAVGDLAEALRARTD